MIQSKSKTDYISASSTRKGKKAKASSANLARFLLRFEYLLSPVFGLVDGPHNSPEAARVELDHRSPEQVDD